MIPALHSDTQQGVDRVIDVCAAFIEPLRLEIGRAVTATGMLVLLHILLAFFVLQEPDAIKASKLLDMKLVLAALSSSTAGVNRHVGLIVAAMEGNSTWSPLLTDLRKKALTELTMSPEIAAVKQNLESDSRCSLDVIKPICGRLEAWRKATRPGGLEGVNGALIESIQGCWRNFSDCSSFSAELHDELMKLDEYGLCLNLLAAHFAGEEDKQSLLKKLKTGTSERRIGGKRVWIIGSVSDHLQMFVQRPCPGSIQSQLNAAFKLLEPFGKLDNNEALTSLALQAGALLWKMQVPDSVETCQAVDDGELAPMRVASCRLGSEFKV